MTKKSGKISYLNAYGIFEVCNQHLPLQLVRLRLGGFEALLGLLYSVVDAVVDLLEVQMDLVPDVIERKPAVEERGERLDELEFDPLLDGLHLDDVLERGLAEVPLLQTQLGARLAEVVFSDLKIFDKV